MCDHISSTLASSSSSFSELDAETRSSILTKGKVSSKGMLMFAHPVVKKEAATVVNQHLVCFELA